MRNIWKQPTDVTRCDNKIKAAATIVNTADATIATCTNTQPAAAVITQPAERVIVGGVPMLSAVLRAQPTPVASSAPVVTSLHNLSRRPATSWEQERAARCYVMHHTDLPVNQSRCMTAVQDAWDSFLEKTRGLCTKDFWYIYLRLHTCSINAIDAALNAIKKLYVSDKKRFPISRRALLRMMAPLESFWTQVSHTYEVQLSQFKLPSGTKSVTFKFLDPVWGWIMAAREQHPAELHWKPVSQVRGFEVYGGGIQYGKFFRQACESLPAGSYPMCIGLHWDGTEARGLGASPICVCVGNTNSCSRSTQFCIGYVPHVPDELQPEWKRQSIATTVKFFIRQKCSMAILRVMEECAKRGVTCRLLNKNNEEVERLLYPRFSSTNFDQPEAQLFYGLQNKQSCGKCRRRKGYSAFRHGTYHNFDDVRRLYIFAHDRNSPHHKTARATLKRWGFNWKRKCCLLTCCPT